MKDTMDNPVIVDIPAREKYFAANHINLEQYDFTNAELNLALRSNEW